MSISDPLNNLGSIWYHSEPSEVPYSPNQYLDRDFFATSYSKAALEQDNKKRRRKDNNYRNVRL